jgi:hypothetical protein
MIVEQITNEADGTSVSITECGVLVQSPRASIHHAFEDSTEILWFIGKLKFLHGITVAGEADAAKERRESKPTGDSDSRFAAMRQMLAESGGDQL